ncbi:MAG: ABC transporter substrate-binding protein [Thermoanaerobaculia bacterium]
MSARAPCAALALLLSVVPLAASRGPSQRPGRPAGAATGLAPIVLGVSNVQSGPSRFLGEKLLRGSRAYFEKVNASGGVHGRQISLVVKDDAYEPDRAVRNTHELIQRKDVLFLFGSVGTPTLVRVLPLLRYYEKERIVNVAPFTGAEPQRQPPYDRFVFNIRASYRDETRALVRHLHAHGHRRFGLLWQADAYGKSGEIGVRDALAEMGLSLVESVSYRRNQHVATAMTDQVRLLREAGADAVIAVGVYGPCAAFVRDARLAGWRVPIANVSFVGAGTMLEALREASADLGLDLTRNLLNSQVVPSPEDLRHPLVAEYRAHTPPDESGFVGLEGWLNAVVVTEALQRAGPDTSREGFIRAMESLAGWDPGVGHLLQLSPSSHQALHAVWLTRTENGRWVPEEDAGK